MKYLALGKRLKKFRQKKGLSVLELADKLGLSESEVLSYEKDQDAPSIAILIKISKALDINVADVFHERPGKQDFEIVRKAERERPKATKDYSFETLTLPNDSKHLDAYLIEVPPKQVKESRDTVAHPGEEFIYVLEGRIAGEISGQQIELNEGDSLFLHSESPHKFFNPSDQVARAIAVLYPY